MTSVGESFVLFYTDKLLEPRREVRTHSDLTSSPTHTSKQQETDEIISTSYGKSFAKLSLNDFGDTTFRPSANLSEPTRSHFDTPTYKPTTPRTDFSTHSPWKQFPHDGAPITSHPPMKFGFGPSPYQTSPRAHSDAATVYANLRNELSTSGDSHRTTGHHINSKNKSRSKEKYVNDNNTESHRKQMYCTPINVGNLVHGQEWESSGKRPASTPAWQSTLYENRDVCFVPVRQPYSWENTGNISQKGLWRNSDLTPTDTIRSTRSDRARFGEPDDATTGSLILNAHESTPRYINDQSQDIGKGQFTYRYPSSDYRSERVAFNTSHSTNLPTDQDSTIHENHSARDEHVSFLEKFRKEKEHYETVLGGTMQTDNHRSLATIAESNTTDDPSTTSRNDTTLVDTDQKGHDYDPQQSTGQNGSFATVSSETTRQNNREMMGTPVASSSPVPSSVYRVRDRQYNREMMDTPMATSTPVPSPVDKVFKQGR